MKHRFWIALCVILLVIGLVGSIVMLRRPHGTWIEIVQDSKVLYRLDLAGAEDQTIKIEYEGRVNIVQIENHKVRMLEADTTVALIIFVIELRIPNPIPIPGVKLGLANIITVYAVYHYRAKEVMMIVFCRIVLGAVFSGNIMALAYSFAGSFLCLAGMLGLRKIIDMGHIWISSIFGAVLHNIGQISIAVLVMGKGILFKLFVIHKLTQFVFPDTANPAHLLDGL